MELDLPRIAGREDFATLPSGTYTVTVNHGGFSPFVRQDVGVSINEVVRVDVLMIRLGLHLGF